MIPAAPDNQPARDALVMCACGRWVIVKHLGLHQAIGLAVAATSCRHCRIGAKQI